MHFNLVPDNFFDVDSSIVCLNDEQSSDIYFGYISWAIYSLLLD